MTRKPNPDNITYGDIAAASIRIRGGVRETELIYSTQLSQLTGMEIYLKMEHHQVTGSFKERGALFTLLCLTNSERKSGVVAASAGNHALALAYHGQRLGIPVTVVMPRFAPVTKADRCKKYGAEVHLSGENIIEAKEFAEALATEQGKLYVNGYNDGTIIVGAGTTGIEILKELPDADAILVPVGGGGLIAGIGIAAKELSSTCQIIGVESEACPSFSAAMQAGKPVSVVPSETLADGLRVPIVGERALRISQQVVDKAVVVSERYIAVAILRLIEMHKTIVEGAGATGLAAVLAGCLPELKGKKVVLPLCGGNIDSSVLPKVITKGMVSDGRLLMFYVQISDRPGGLANFCSAVCSFGGNIWAVVQEHAVAETDVYHILVRCVVEVLDSIAGARMVVKLKEAGYNVQLHQPIEFPSVIASKL